ncbi:RNA-binding cell elongation regulator Jag/EloR [Paenibacillus sp. NPDC056579]|uniref:RNA-binding cell elongation regulator Jag/EloR n=1 Tax=unclassified Paenibacillus TaxID=185978 RepID=UPI001EF807EF|nr:RNA-binding cell elongation regulator Jag/EloR [Paenibacillus sp. H1-7]ULL13005.1 protein jag [Paenibacillus sp. H1-7]
MKKIVVTGKSIEEAVKNGLQQWNTTEDRVKIVVLEQPSKGLFGLIGAKDAKVELELIPDAVEEAIHFLQEVFQTMSLQVRIEKKSTKEGLELHLFGSELGMLIGRRGQTLDALQYLVNIVANRYSTSHMRIVLDAEQFRERRKKTLEDLAARLAERVIRTKKEVVLEPMSPQERKVIHAKLQDHPKVRTFSRGEEPNRRVVILSR